MSASAARRWSTLVAAALLATGLTACGSDDSSGDGSSSDSSANATSSGAASAGTSGSTTTAVPPAATQGATWLEHQLEHGVLVNHQYKSNDDSTTVELAYALRAVDPDAAALSQISAALAKDATSYTSFNKDVYAGATGKLLAFATDTGADTGDFGGIDLVSQMEELTTDSGATAGRIADKTDSVDYANVFGQIWAVRGLLNAGSDEADAAEKFLLQQQCDDGYLRQDFSKPTAADQGCSASDPASIDTTALLVVLLKDKAEGDQALSEAIDKAVAWLEEQQSDDGSFVLNTGPQGGAANSDSTGLAASALRLAGDDDAAAEAATWVRAHQIPTGCSGELAAAGGAIAYDDTALTQAAGRGITDKTAYQWRLASAQALAALLSVPADAPAAECPSK